MVLDKESAKCLTINTHLGLYQYTRLPFGAPPMFQRAMDKILQGIEGVICYIDAIVQAPEPENEQQLRLFLGLLNYYSKFIPNLATILHPLNQLLR